MIIGIRPKVGLQGLALLGALLLVLQAGCGNDSTTQPVTKLAPPSALTYINGEESITLSWTSSSYQGASDFKEYAVYRSTSTMVGVGDNEISNYRIGASQTTSYVDATVELGQKYYYAVRTVKDNGDISVPTSEIDTAARTESDPNTLAEFAYTNHSSGLQASTGLPLPMVFSNKDKIDVYLGTLDTNDAATAELAFKSPSLVSGPNDWSDRVAQLKLLDSWDTPTTTTAGWTDEIPLGTTDTEIVGKVIAVKTPPQADGKAHYAKILVTSYSPGSAAGQRTIQVKVAYQPIAEYIRFSR